jgi:hypothetical protein
MDADSRKLLLGTIVYLAVLGSVVAALGAAFANQ